MVTDVALEKGQFVCTYNAEILDEDVASARERAWDLEGGALGAATVLPEQVTARTRAQPVLALYIAQ